jgi:hypothetical protein
LPSSGLTLQASDKHEFFLFGGAAAGGDAPIHESRRISPALADPPMVCKRRCRLVTIALWINAL